MTFIVFTYNEAKRIRHVLEHAQKWAEEIVVFDKGSTDGTLEICRSFGERVRVVSIPFSERGHEDYAPLIAEHAKQDWVFLSTCSEIPTRKLIEKCREVLVNRAEKLDLIFVPRLMYFFGQHRSPENGGVAYYPFLFHKDRALITRDIHNNFQARDPKRTYRIPYEEDCCVHHMTHPTVRSFWLASQSYFEMEVQKKESAEEMIRESFKNIEKLSKRMLLEGDSWLPFYCALASYELGRALSVWEKEQGPERAGKIYAELSERLVAEEWMGTSSGAAKAAVNKGPTRFKTLKPLIIGLAQLPYLLAKMKYGIRKPRVREK